MKKKGLAAGVINCVYAVALLFALSLTSCTHYIAIYDYDMIVTGVKENKNNKTSMSKYTSVCNRKYEVSVKSIYDKRSIAGNNDIPYDEIILYVDCLYQVGDTIHIR